MASHLESSIEGIIKVFHSYSGREGDKYKLSKSELKNLLEGEFGDSMKSCKDPQVLEHIMSGLDEDKDGEISFQEFVVLVFELTVTCNEFFQDMKDQGSKKV
ncbi:protein S100-A1 [Gymnodraco acuticeps]|uniref:Protein S100 n=3 Tax=Notothenioidei TaxID=8205 RepID=A0A6P8XB42_GYMAC|nr:protein S100-A1 [Trematomus bernacchii]XP_034097277.1 protein S100-A1 [Gymnodraco acuticeps]KAJ4948655.1 hypothetical protein JOQ06_020185 [Pogonophryne albipinna]